jgi:uncharacterized MAPEG superfamily protein
MDATALRLFLLALILLLIKFVALTLVQAKVRFATRTFRWPEDALAWHGSAASGREPELSERAQAALRNDGESQPLFMAIATTWLLLGGAGVLAWALPAYALLRALHALLLLRAVQPARNRVFGSALLLLLALAADAVRLAWASG